MPTTCTAPADPTQPLQAPPPMPLERKCRNKQASPRTCVVLNNMGVSSNHQRAWWPASALGMASDVGRGLSAAAPGSPRASYSPLAYARRQRGPPSESPGDAEDDSEEEELSYLLSLALSKAPSSEADAIANDMDMAMELGKTETSEGTALNLLSTLHSSNHGRQQPQPLACTNLLASTGEGLGMGSILGRGGYGIKLRGTIVPEPPGVAPNSESGEVPLVSKRAAGCRTLDNLCVLGCEARAAASPHVHCSIEQQGQQQQQACGYPVLAGVPGGGVVVDAAAGSGGSAGAGVGGGRSGVGALQLTGSARADAGIGVVSMLTGMRSGSPLSCFRPHPAWPAQGGRLLYVAVFLTQESRDVLLAMVPPLHPLVSADHMTLAYKPISVPQLLAFPLGASVQLSVIGAAADSRAQAVAADPPSWLPPTASVSTHVTISVALGARPIEAGHLIRDALQHTATADPAGPGPCGAGAYQHFEEPLQLVGRLGVKLALPSGEVVVVYSVDDLAAGGYISLCSDDIDTFYSMHSERVKRPLQQQHSPTSLLDLPFTVSSSSSRSSSGGGSGGSFSPLNAAATADIPPLQLPLPLMGSPMDATNSCWSSGTAAAADGGGSCNVQEQQQLLLPFVMPCTNPCADDESAEQLLNNSTDDAPCDDTASSSSSDSDAVQFRSAVQVGDYVALRPFVPTDTGETLVQGYVREYACEEAFQGNGVMVVLTDNTIGFVVAVLDAAAGGGGSSISRTAAQRKASRPSKRSKAATVGDAGGLPALNAAASDAADVLSEWALSAHDAGEVAAAAAGLGRRNAADAARDMQLWAEFDALQRQHGEELCNAILRSCDHDFVEAIATIRAQAAGFGGGAAGGAAAAPAAVMQLDMGAAADHTGFGAAAEVEQQQLAAPLTEMAAAAAGPDEELVVQLALSLGQPAEAALSLFRLVQHMAPEHAVEALQQHGGDANKAADALLAAEAEAEAAAAAAAIAAAADGAAAGEPAAAAACGRSRHSPPERVAASFVRGKDPALVVSARSLCSMFAGLQQELAELVLQEHGGSLEQAGRAISDMQAKELQVRTAASAADNASSPCALPPAASLTEQQQQVGQQQHFSEEDQMAMLAAMGLLDPAEQQQQQQQPINSYSPSKRQQRTPLRTPQPCSPLLAPAQHQQQPHPTLPSARPSSSNSTSGYTAFSSYKQQQQGVYGSPVHCGMQQQQQGMAGNYGDQEAKLAAKAAADKLYTKSKTLSQGALVLMTAAQAMLVEKDEEGYREKKAAAERLRAESRAAFDEAQRLSWSANNKGQQTWQVDLHGLGTSVALRKFVTQFSGLEAMASGHPGGVLYQVITGKGKHSEDNVPKIKLGVLQYLQEKRERILQETGRHWAVTWQVDPCNEGLLNVYIPGCIEDDPEDGGHGA